MRMIAKELVPFVELAARTGIGAMPGNCIPAAVKYISGCTFTQKNYPSRRRTIRDVLELALHARAVCNN